MKMDKVSEIKQDKSKTTPSSHRDFFAKLYGSLEEEYNKKRGLDSKNSSSSGNAIVTDAAHVNLINENNSKLGHNIFGNTVEDESEDEKESKNDNKEFEISLSAETSPGSSPTKDEEISPPRVPPPTLRQFQNRLQVSTKIISEIQIFHSKIQ